MTWIDGYHSLAFYQLVCATLDKKKQYVINGREPSRVMWPTSLNRNQHLRIIHNKLLLIHCSENPTWAKISWLSASLTCLIWHDFTYVPITSAWSLIGSYLSSSSAYLTELGGGRVTQILHNYSSIYIIFTLRRGTHYAQGKQGDRKLAKLHILKTYSPILLILLLPVPRNLHAHDTCIRRNIWQ